MKKFFTIISLMFIVGGVTASDNANLTNIIVSSGNLVPVFNPNITNYTLNVLNMVTDITLQGIAEDPEATVTGNVFSEPINVGSNLFTLTVTATDGITTKDYYINVIRAFSGDGADLASLTVDPGVLVPAFSPNVTTYTVNVANSATVMNYITGVPDDPSATVTGNVVNAPLNVGSNLFTITVTAADGVTTKSYYVTVIRAGSIGTNANLANLIYSTGTLTPVFNPNTTVYTLNVMHVVTDITLKGIPEDLSATVTGNVNNAPINVGSNPFVLTVTSGDGTVTKDYYVNVVRATIDSNANLGSLTVVPGSLAPAFSPTITNYTVNVAYLVTTITITGTAQSAYATVTGNVINAPLTVGNNLFTITVTAQDGITIKNYAVTVVRSASSANANLASLTVNPGALNPAFSPNMTNYTVNVEESVAAISITGVAADPYATVTGNVTNAPIKKGNNLFTITVTAQDGVTVKNYYVTVVRAGIPQYVITAIVEDNIGGTISPKGMIIIGQGESITYKMTPDDGYHIIYVLVDNVNVGPNDSYTFNHVTSDHTIVVMFGEGTGIAPLSPSEGGNVQIYPNPTNGLITICDMRYAICDNPTSDIEIFDIMGRAVHVETRHATSLQSEIGNRKSEITFDLSNVPAGIYFIRIQTETGIVTRKVVKQ
ncbi:MAG: cadherin-like beta sandwich domain-containing protein [Bacteroidales bacterium]|nr:cadherin-like beta sandwich domain-containing protein [Bacteroidales bacterium]